MKLKLKIHAHPNALLIDLQVQNEDTLCIISKSSLDLFKWLLHAGRLMSCDQASFFGKSAKVGGTLGARDFSSAVSGFCQVFIVTRAKSAFFSLLRRTTEGRHRKFPPHARKTSGSQGKLPDASHANRNGQGPPDRKIQHHKQRIRFVTVLCFRRDSIKPRFQPSF